MELEFRSIKLSSLYQRRPEAVENPSTADETTGDWESPSVPPWPCLLIVCFCFKSLGGGMLVGMEGLDMNSDGLGLNLW